VAGASTAESDAEMALKKKPRSLQMAAMQTVREDAADRADPVDLVEEAWEATVVSRMALLAARKPNMADSDNTRVATSTEDPRVSPVRTDLLAMTDLPVKTDHPVMAKDSQELRERVLAEDEVAQEKVVAVATVVASVATVNVAEATVIVNVAMGVPVEAPVRAVWVDKVETEDPVVAAPVVHVMARLRSEKSLTSQVVSRPPESIF